MIILIRVNSEETINNPPLGLLYVGDALKKAGYDVKVYHVSENDILSFTEEIISLNPLWVGFSVNTGWSMRAALRLTSIIKDAGIPTVWGNAHASILPHQCLLEVAIDFVVIGEGEVTAVELSKAIAKKADYHDIKGIGFKESGGRIIITKSRELIEDLDQYEMDWTLLDPDAYVFEAPQFGMKRAFQFITSRGCPHSCGFCFNQEFNRGRWRAHSEHFVIDKVLALKEKLGLDGIRFWDDNFFTNRKRAFRILDAIGLPYTSEIRVDYFNEEFAKKLSASGCKMVLLGLESGSDRILKLINKNTTRKANWEALKLLNRYPQISIHPSVIVGFPSETEDEYKETLDMFAEMIRTHPNFWFVRLGIWVPYPGCDLYKRAVADGIKMPARIEEWDDLLFDTSKSKSLVCVDWIADKRDIEIDEEYLVMLNKMVHSRIPYGPLIHLLHWRIKNRFYGFPVEKTIFHIVGSLLKGIRKLVSRF